MASNFVKDRHPRKAGLSEVWKHDGECATWPKDASIQPASESDLCKGIAKCKKPLKDMCDKSNESNAEFNIRKGFCGYDVSPGKRDRIKFIPFDASTTDFTAIASSEICVFK